MGAVQWLVIALTAVAAALASFFYNDGRDHHLKLTLQAGAVIAFTGMVLFYVGEALTPPVNAAPQCAWTDLDDDLTPNCESSAEASRRAAEESLGHFVSTYLVGPTVELAAVVAGGLVGFVAAGATGRSPSDGRPRRVLVDDD